MNFLEKMEKYCLENKLFKPKEKILITISGGPDSTALLVSFKHLSAKYHLKLLAAHVNYQLRGKESQRDQEHCQKLCQKMGINFVQKKAPIKKKKGIENLARKIRFNYFFQIKKLYKIHRIALGHNKNDQAETLLFRLARGSAITGLRGITPKNNSIIHPLLIFKRSEIVAFLKKQKITWVHDSSNERTDFTRNKIRHKILPYFQNNINNRTIDHIYQSSLIFSETEEILKITAQNKLNRLRKRKSDYVFSIEKLKKIKQILRFYIYRKIFKDLSGNKKGFYFSNFK